MSKYVHIYVREFPEARGLGSPRAEITDQDTKGDCWELNWGQYLFLITEPSL